MSLVEYFTRGWPIRLKSLRRLADLFVALVIFLVATTSICRGVPFINWTHSSRHDWSSVWPNLWIILCCCYKGFKPFDFCIFLYELILESTFLLCKFFPDLNNFGFPVLELFFKVLLWFFVGSDLSFEELKLREEFHYFLLMLLLLSRNYKLTICLRFSKFQVVLLF